LCKKYNKTAAPELKRYSPFLDWEHSKCYVELCENPSGEMCKFADVEDAMDEIKRQVWNDTLEAAAQKVESLWAFRTCREVADAIRDMKKDS
jgi:hypothetical protein